MNIMNQNTNQTNCDIFFDFKKENIYSTPASENQIEYNTKPFIYLTEKQPEAMELEGIHEEQYYEHKYMEGETFISMKAENSENFIVEKENTLLFLPQHNRRRSRDSGSSSDSSNLQPYLSLNISSKASCGILEEKDNEQDYDQKNVLRRQNRCKNTRKCNAKSKTRRKAWQQHEDEQLLELVKEHGTKWAKIATLMKDRTGKQIRDRYLNNLSPKIEDREWTKDEDTLLLLLYFKWGKKWSKIAAKLPGRSEGQVKNRFYWELKRKALCSDVINHKSIYMGPISNLQQLRNSNIDINQPKNINFRKKLQMDTPNIYLDYPIFPQAPQLGSSQEQIFNFLKPQIMNPEDFISYANPSNIKSDLEKFLNDYPSN